MAVQNLYNITGGVENALIYPVLPISFAAAAHETEPDIVLTWDGTNANYDIAVVEYSTDQLTWLPVSGELRVGVETVTHADIPESEEEVTYYYRLRAKKRFKWSEYITTSCEWGWTTQIIASHKAINNHIPSTYYNTYYAPVLREVLSPSYADSEGVGYYYNTFGPNGLDRENADFFLLFFFYANITANAQQYFAPSTNVRLNIEGTIYNQHTRPNHVWTGKDYLIVTNGGALQNLNTFRWSGSLSYRYLPSFRYCNSTAIQLWLINGWGIDNFIGDMTNYVWHQNHGSSIQLSYNSFSGKTPPIKAGMVLFRVPFNWFTEINVADSIISVALTEIDINNNRIEMPSLLALILKLNAFYSVTAPTQNVTIKLEGEQMGCIEGEEVGGVWQENAAIILLRGYFTAAAKTLTLTYNSDQYSFGANVGILSIDDGVMVDKTLTLPVLNKYGVKGTFHVNGDFIGDAQRLTWADLQEMDAAGHDIQCHTFSHPDMTTQSEAQVRAQYTDQDAIFAANSMAAPTITAYPIYKHNANVRLWTADYRALARAGGGGVGSMNFLYKNADKMQLTASIADATTEAQVELVKLSINACIRRKGIFCFSLHSKYGTYGVEPELLDKILDYAINVKGMTIITFKQFNDTYGADFV